MSAVRHDDGEDAAPLTWDLLYISLVPLPAALLGAALLSDALYWFTAAAVCARASEWLLGAGLGTGAIWRHGSGSYTPRLTGRGTPPGWKARVFAVVAGCGSTGRKPTPLWNWW